VETKLQTRLRLISVYLGNLFEHYDTALYTFLSPFFATIFFPQKDKLTALILTFAIAPLGMIARPIGSLIFGYIGDVKGRSRALFLSLCGMAIVTASVALLPTGAQAGGLAAMLLLVTRILQNFFAAGENMGGAVAFLESLKSEKEKDIASSIYNTSTVLGLLLASAMVTLLYHFNWVENGWRWLYIGGAITAFIGVLIRYFSPITQTQNIVFRDSLKHFAQRLRSFWKLRYTVLMITVAAGFSYGSYSVAFSLMNGFVPLISDITQSEITKVNTALLLFDIILLPIFGSLASRYNRNRMMSLAALTAVITGAPLFYFLDHCTLLTVILVRMSFVTIGVWFSSTFHSWSQSLLPKEYRYSIISFSYSIGSQLLGGTVATTSLWLYKQTSLVTSASWYWIFLGLVTFAFLTKARPAISTVGINK
jgi:MHS family proline/betaine transporter-like MFS transporter